MPPTAAFVRARRSRLSRAAGGAFTLIELLLSITILTILMLIVTNVISVVQKTWVRANSRVSEYREARGAFDTMVRNLSQATLNTYWQSVDPLGTVTKTFQSVGSSPNAMLANAYVRQSELQFVCGSVPNMLGGGFANPTDNPGHAVFFQAPLGVTRLVAPGVGFANTENMVNLLCGRGYFVAWGDDVAFRPSFLNSLGEKIVRKRYRYRLMEFSPTAEKNKIYEFRPLVDPINPLKNYSKKWFQDALAGSTATADEDKSNRAPLRPIADNVICLVLSPQQDAGDNTGGNAIAPRYEYDSLLKTNPGATANNANPQGTQHLLPPLIKVTMIVVDSAGGERLAENDALRQSLGAQMSNMFTDATNFDSPNSSYRGDLATLESFLVQSRLNYRVFTTTVIMKAARWST